MISMKIPKGWRSKVNYSSKNSLTSKLFYILRKICWSFFIKIDVFMQAYKIMKNIYFCYFFLAFINLSNEILTLKVGNNTLVHNWNSKDFSFSDFRVDFFKPYQINISTFQLLHFFYFSNSLLKIKVESLKEISFNYLQI